MLLNNNQQRKMDCQNTTMKDEQLLATSKFVCSQCLQIKDPAVEILKTLILNGRQPTPSQILANGPNVISVIRNGQNENMSFSDALTAAHYYRRSVECHLPLEKSCPECQLRIFKMDGGQVVHCPYCINSICWICDFKSWNGSKVYLHLWMKHNIDIGYFNDDDMRFLDDKRLKWKKCLRWNQTTLYEEGRGRLECIYLYVIQDNKIWNLLNSMVV